MPMNRSYLSGNIIGDCTVYECRPCTRYIHSVGVERAIEVQRLPVASSSNQEWFIEEYSISNDDRQRGCLRSRRPYGFGIDCEDDGPANTRPGINCFIARD